MLSLVRIGAQRSLSKKGIKELCYSFHPRLVDAQFVVTSIRKTLNPSRRFSEEKQLNIFKLCFEQSRCY